ncbi:aminoacyl-tRNA hydrolase [Floccifex sp.]|uniref:aminoacyl-tRNA hydrolase n=1 Tax=Floccifex sp. TaxID=2815810 RepID=UPI002A74AA9C|nr:aminoacyl-tRNA hydrolase [Floccifex sp.]MDD7280566.1 aminoacyl-tRNA hydrolase [Erysipelotrichaceae bacterium]MDY2958633.1 aminoacyl-tRNA hydrolase [Floccifex sp.]
MKIIIGLGNPGKDYENTRHNAGFMVMDEIAKKCNLEFNKEKFDAYFAKGKIKGEDVVLLKPTTYMNNSGFALRACLDFYKETMDNVLVIYDDKDLPVGKIRLRQQGSAGGHNGIKSIMNCTQNQTFDRIRVGIGKDDRIPIIQWVLSKFRKEEQEDLQKAITQASEAAYYAIDHSFDKVMNQYNKK